MLMADARWHNSRCPQGLAAR